MRPTPALQNLVGGQVHGAFLPLLAVTPHVDSGKVRVLVQWFALCGT